MNTSRNTPHGADVARLHDTRNVTRTSAGLEDTTPADETKAAEPVDYDEPPKPAPKKPNRAARRKLFKLVKARSAERKAVRRAHDAKGTKK